MIARDAPVASITTTEVMTAPKGCVNQDLDFAHHDLDGRFGRRFYLIIMELTASRQTGDGMAKSKNNEVRHRPGIPRVALLIETSTAYGRRVFRGVSEEYLRSHGPWSVSCGQRDILDRPPAWLEDWQGEGVISRVPDPGIAAWSRERGITVGPLKTKAAQRAYRSEAGRQRQPPT
jgi:hypothetical protein